MEKKNVSDLEKLELLLTKKFGNRFSIDVSSLLNGGMSATLDFRRFYITFEENKYLLVSTFQESRELLDELLPFLIEVMGNEHPICSYDLQQEIDVMPTIEWDVVAPEDRIRDLVKNKGFLDGTKILNLKLYNDKKESDYLDIKKRSREYNNN